MTRFAMAFDMARCTGCKTCVVACQQHNALRPGVAWTWVDTLEWGRWPDGDRAALPHGCLHCDDPACANVCPTGASRRRDDGIVAVEYDRCIGCGVCLTACPYGARTINARDGWHFGAAEPAPYENAPTQRLGVAEKCTLCADRVDEGLEPACVAACPVGVRAFGDLDDPDDALHDFAADAGAARVEGAGVLYAVGAHALDVEEEIRTRYHRAATEATAPEGPREGNPVVVAGAGVAAAALAAGAGVAAKRNRDRRAERAQAPNGPEA